jgi:hypothetical protein
LLDGFPKREIEGGCKHQRDSCCKSNPRNHLPSRLPVKERVTKIQKLAVTRRAMRHVIIPERIFVRESALGHFPKFRRPAATDAVRIGIMPQEQLLQEIRDLVGRNLVASVIGHRCLTSAPLHPLLYGH